MNTFRVMLRPRIQQILNKTKMLRTYLYTENHPTANSTIRDIHLSYIDRESNPLYSIFAHKYKKDIYQSLLQGLAADSKDRRTHRPNNIVR